MACVGEVGQSKIGDINIIIFILNIYINRNIYITYIFIFYPYFIYFLNRYLYKNITHPLKSPGELVCH